ncbi:MAG: hypothetical protein ACKO5K_15835 [Armatimonadota bacterium]
MSADTADVLAVAGRVYWQVMSERMSLVDAIRFLKDRETEATFLALGQTALWDEPVKAGVAAALRVHWPEARFLAGVHDTDYFAKLPGHPSSASGEPYVALRHDDHATRGLWSAAGEMHVLLGSEDVPTRALLRSDGGADLHRGLRGDEHPDERLVEWTEAWGWTGLIRTGWRREIVAEIPLRRILPALLRQLRTTVDASLAVAPDGDVTVAERIGSWLEEVAQVRPDPLLADAYEDVLRRFHAWLEPGNAPLATTRSSHLLRFNPDTAGRPRFALLSAFLDPRWRSRAGDAYDAAVAGSDIYPLGKFGEGATPFDLFVPGHGRGTLRLLPGRVAIDTPAPLTIEGNPRSLEDFAALLSNAHGPDCVLLGKAVSLLPMLGAEHHFVFHEGASGYSGRSARFVAGLRHAGISGPDPLPILRVAYPTLDALASTRSKWFHLPAHLRQAFGRDRIDGEDLAACWRRGVDWERSRLGEWKALRSPRALLDQLARTLGGHWPRMAREHADITERLLGIVADARAAKAVIFAFSEETSRLQWRFDSLHREKGFDFRQRGGWLDADAIAERAARFDAPITALRLALRGRRTELRALRRRVRSIERSQEAVALRCRLQAIESEAERERIRQVSHAVRTVHGLPHANARPSAWWFPFVDGTGGWYQRTVEGASVWCEPLTPDA